ncbi:MAG: mercuric reductase [Acidobacteriota bacterium]|nr:mercuric reductase [Acidobacteriota bacterium]
MSEPLHPALDPLDEHNRTLRDHVHPTDWTNPEPADRYHMVVIGAGTAGLVTAVVAAGLGARVALVERDLMGGDCLNVGCVPSKGVIGAARAWHAARSGAAFGAPVATEEGDFATAMERMRRLRAGISHLDSAARFRDLGVDVFLGKGRFVDRSTVEVGGARLRFCKATIATGARAAAPPIPGLADVDYLTNETVFSLTKLPESFGIIGAGPIGCELAQSFARFGSNTTLLDVAPQVLIREDPDAALIVQDALVAEGVALELGARIQAVEARGGKKVVRYETDDGAHEVEVDQLLVAVGRAPNVEGLELEAAGVEYDKTGVHVDGKLRTSNRRIFAAGDITPLLKFTHLADAHAGIVIRNAFFFGRARHQNLVVPWCTYTSPEIAHVGLYEKDLVAEGKKPQLITVPMAEVDRAVLDGQDAGFLRLVLEAGSDRIVGATLVAEHAGDMIGEAAVAITHRIPIGKIGATIHPYPTQGEVYRKAANVWVKGRLTPTAKRFLDFWFRLFR